MSGRYGDVRQRPRLSVTMIPGLNEVTEANTSIAAGAAATFVITTLPDDDHLGLWNFLISVFVDYDLLEYSFPGGASLDAARRSMRLSIWVDWAESSDTTNVRVVKARIENTDISTHTYYLKFKAYTFASITGSN